MRSAVLELFANFYRYLISPVVHAWAGPGAGCRYDLSCSQFAKQAVETHGWFRGGALALGRILRCQPWGRGGEDPVPPRQDCGRKSL